MADIIVMEDHTLSKKYEKRFVVVDKNTGEILDDAQGHGYSAAVRCQKKSPPAWRRKADSILLRDRRDLFPQPEGTVPPGR